jgi:hypothetical protein
MGEYTFWEAIITKIRENTIDKLEYYFAKRWLDKHFSEKEYWGEYIAKKIIQDKHD